MMYVGTDAEFVGGPKDGLWLHMNGTPPLTWRFPRPSPISAEDWFTSVIQHEAPLLTENYELIGLNPYLCHARYVYEPMLPPCTCDSDHDSDHDHEEGPA